jgi:hypothetical protein
VAPSLTLVLGPFVCRSGDMMIDRVSPRGVRPLHSLKVVHPEGWRLATGGKPAAVASGCLVGVTIASVPFTAQAAA